MQPPMIVEVQVATQPLPGVPRCDVLVQVDLFIFDRAPQALRQDVVQGAPLAIHTNLHPSGKQSLSVLRTREMAPLIAVPDPGTTDDQRCLHAFKHEIDVQCMIQTPTHHIA